MQTITSWSDEVLFPITVCDTEGLILYMNERAKASFSKEGGEELVGKSLINCHPEPARSKLLDLMETQKENTYTISKNGISKLIHQSPWYENGVFGGLIEISIEIPNPLPNFVRN